MSATRQERILIADHDHTFLDQLADRLLQMNAEVDFAENGRTAIQLVESESYDLIITEIAMPIYNGLEIFRRSKELNPNTPVLVTSFSATTDWAEQALREGAHSYLLRPLNNMNEFDHAVENALRTTPTTSANSFFNHIFSKDSLVDPTISSEDIPIPDWEMDHDQTFNGIDSELTRAKPLVAENVEPFNSIRLNSGMKEQNQRVQSPLLEGFIELNPEGQILSCDATARSWLMLEANTPERPIKNYIKALGTRKAPINVETKLAGRIIAMNFKKIHDQAGTERIILKIQETKKQDSAIPAQSRKTTPHSMKQRSTKATDSVAFGGNLKKYNPDNQDQGWSPLVFIDQMKKTLKDEVERIKENNPLHMFEAQPEEADPEVVMTMSQRLSDISKGRRSSF
jgi:DNA-binding response OmpR family regulator